MDAHLDSHFRQNRRMKERVKRGLSRSWFVTEEEWISGSGGELTSHQGREKKDVLIYSFNLFSLVYFSSLFLLLVCS